MKEWTALKRVTFSSRLNSGLPFNNIDVRMTDSARDRGVADIVINGVMVLTNTAR